MEGGLHGYFLGQAPVRRLMSASCQGNGSIFSVLETAYNSHHAHFLNTNHQ